MGVLMGPVKHRVVMDGLRDDPSSKTVGRLLGVLRSERLHSLFLFLVILFIVRLCVSET